MTVKFTTEKELDEFLATVAPSKKDPFAPRYTPSKYDNSGRLAEATEEFKEGCKNYWKTSNFSFLECSDDLRKNSSAICSVMQWFPRELKNAHPDFLENRMELSAIMEWWFNKVIPASEITHKQAFQWTLFFLKPSVNDQWFYRWYCLNVSFSMLPKKLQTKEFFIRAFETYPRIANKILDSDSGNFDEPLFLEEFMKDMKFKLAVYNACIETDYFNKRWNKNDYAEEIVGKFAMKDTPFCQKILRSDKPLDELASAIGGELWVA